jgi:hypothetical protein
VVSVGRGYFPRGILLVERGRDLLDPGARSDTAGSGVSTGSLAR